VQISLVDQVHPGYFLVAAQLLYSLALTLGVPYARAKTLARLDDTAVLRKQAGC